MCNTTANSQTNNKLMKDIEGTYKLISCIHSGFNELYNLTTNYLREQCSDGQVYSMLQDGLYNENSKSGEKLYTKDNFNKIGSYCDICAFVEFTGCKFIIQSLRI